MELYVVRHGQTDYNMQNIFQGHIDTSLNDLGIKQAKLVASKLKDFKVDVILSSPLRRAIETSKYISNTIKSPIQIEKALIERNFGNMEGKANREDWNIKMMLDYEKNYSYENIEPIQSLFNRVYNFLDEIKVKYKNKNVVLVTHGGISQVIECYFNGMPNPINFSSLECLTLKNCELRKYVI